MGKPRKRKNPGVGVDFKRVKHKVGKKLPKARNETNTDFTSKSINLPNQSVREDRSGIAVNSQNLTLKELLSQTTHHNDKARKHSLVGLADLFGRHPEQLRLHAGQVLGTLAERCVDGEMGVRSALRELLGGCVLPGLGPGSCRPFMPVLMAHVCGAMTHLHMDVRTDAMLLLDVLMDHVPRLIVESHLAPCFAHFCDVFSTAHRGRSIRALSLTALLKLLTALSSFLQRAFPASPAPSASAAPAVAGTGADGGAAAPAQDAGTAAGPGPGSARQLSLHLLSRTAGLGRALGRDRGRWPARTPAVLLDDLDEQLRAAAAATRAALRAAAGGKRGKSFSSPGGGWGGGGGIEKSRGRKSSGIGTGEAPSGSAGGGPSGGKTVAAAAAALAVVGGAGADATAPPPATKMAAALAAAFDARASALQLVSHLMDCWLECSPGSVSHSPEPDQAAALAMIASACNALMDNVLLPGSGSAEAAAAANVSGAEVGGAGPGADPALVSQLHELVGRRVAAAFPVTMPAVKPQPAVLESLVTLNLQCAQLLCRFLPLLHAQPPQQPGQPQQQTGAAAAPSLPWVPALVSYYEGVLERGVVLPATHGTLADASLAGGAAGSAAGAGAGAAAGPDVVLPAVAGAVRWVDGASAQRLMGAAAAFAARQPPRSAARLACLRMQHGLLHAGLAGRIPLDDSVVRGWLSPLPRLLFELGSAAPEVSAAGLTLLLDAARFAPPGSAMSGWLAEGLQPQLAPLFATQLPDKAARAARAKWEAAAGPVAAAAAGGGGVLALLPGAVTKLPEPVACLGIDLLYHMGPLSPSLLKPLVALLSSSALPPPLALRLLDVLLSRLAHSPDPALAASTLLSLLFGPQYDNLVLPPDGAVNLTSAWPWRRTLVDSTALALGRLGGPAALLRVAAAAVAALPLTAASTAGGGAARVQRYSLVRLAGDAMEEAECGKVAKGAVPGELEGVLAGAVALCGLESGAEEEQGRPGQGQGCMIPMLQLLAARPALVPAVLQALTGMLREGSGVAAAGQQQGAEGAAPTHGSHAVGAIPLRVAALAALRLAAAAVKLQPVRTAALAAGAAAAREGLVAAAGALVRAARELPAAAAAAPDGGSGDHTASYLVESERLAQTVADLYGMPACGL